MYVCIKFVNNIINDMHLDINLYLCLAVLDFMEDHTRKITMTMKNNAVEIRLIDYAWFIVLQDIFIIYFL